MDDQPFAVGVEPTRLHAGLLVGDVAVILLLLGAGMLRHGEVPWLLPERSLLVIGPFLLSWFVAAALLGAYTSDARGSVFDATVNATGTWVVAALGGAALRATPMLPGGAPVSFVAVVVGVGVLGLAAWRGLVTAVVGPAAG